MPSRNPQAERVRLCVQSLHPTDPGNYEGPIRCTAHESHDGECVFSIYQRVGPTFTAHEQAVWHDRAIRGEGGRL